MSTQTELEQVRERLAYLHKLARDTEWRSEAYRAKIEIEELPNKQRKKLPRYPLPALRVARLAAAEEMQGKGIGKLLLRFALQLALDMAEELGCIGVVVDAKEGAVAFYERYGFEPFDVVQGGSNARPMPLAMFLPLGSIPPASA